MKTCINTVYLGPVAFDKKQLIIIKKPISVYIILLEVSNYTGIGIDDMKSIIRKHEIVKARCIAISLIIKYLPILTLKKVGNIFKRDHSTVIYNHRLAEDLMVGERGFKTTYKAIEAQLISKYDISKAPKFQLI